MRVFGSAAVLFGAAAFASGAELVDRSVAVVGSVPVTANEVDLQVRLEALFNETPVDLSESAREAALERLVEQRLIETDMRLAGFRPSSDEDVAAANRELRTQRFAGRTFAEALKAAGVREADAFEFLRRQIDFSRYVEFRFRAGLQADEDELRAAYRVRYGRVERAPAFEQVRDELREQVIEAATQRAIDERIRQLRAEVRVVRLAPIQRDLEAAP